MSSYPRSCPSCGVMTEESGFSADKSKASGRRSPCRACDNRRGKAYYDAHKDELYAQREAVREAAWQAELEALEKEHRKTVAATKRLHAAPGPSPERVSALARRA